MPDLESIKRELQNYGSLESKMHFFAVAGMAIKHEYSVNKVIKHCLSRRVSTASGSERLLAKAPLATARGTDPDKC
jgi:hypothetical protein